MKLTTQLSLSKTLRKHRDLPPCPLNIFMVLCLGMGGGKFTFIPQEGTYAPDEKEYETFSAAEQWMKSKCKIAFQWKQEVQLVSSQCRSRHEI
jgi:hypothetical protein